MIIGIADQFTFTQLIIGALLFLVLQFVIFHFLINRLNSAPADSLEGLADHDSEILGDRPVSSTVAPPRTRRLQPSPRTSGGSSSPMTEKAEEPAVALKEVSKTKESAPIKSLATAGGPETLPGSTGDKGKKFDPYAPIPLTASEKPTEVEVAPIPMISLAAKPEEKPTDKKKVEMAADTKVDEPVAKAPEPVMAETPIVPPAEDKIAMPPLPVPPLAFDAPVEKPANVEPVAAAEPAKVELPSDTLKATAPISLIPVPVSSIPRRQFVNPFEKPPVSPVEAKSEVKVEPGPEMVAETEPEVAVSSFAPSPIADKVEAVDAAMSGGVPAADVAGEESDDVKKRKTPKHTDEAPERSGLVEIPPVAAKVLEVAKNEETPAPVTAKIETPDDKAEPPVGALTLGKTPEANVESASAAPETPKAPPTRLFGRPRIFMSSNAPAPAAAKEEPGEAKGLEVTSVNEPAAEEKPEPVEAKSPEKIEEAAVEEKVEAPVVESKPVEETLKDEPRPLEVPVAEEKTEEPKTDEPKLEEPKAEVEEKPVVEALAETESKHEEVIEPKGEETAPAAALLSGEEPQTFEPVPVPMLPREVHEETTAPEGALSLTTPAPADSITTPYSVMPSTETTPSSATGRASAQLTLGFEITSLQLTPFFKLGGVQLRPLSNIVSLHLIGAQPENPLAAGISFQIDRVELDGSSHLKSIHLKLLGGAQPAATPQPKLQVNAVELTQGSEGSPISITPSEQTSTAVQLLATFTIAAMEFTPSFEIGSLRLEPTSNSVMLRLAPSSRPAALDLPPSFDVTSVDLGGDSQISAVKLTPGGSRV